MIFIFSRRLYYVEAVLLEVMRMYCVVPIIGPRRCLDKTVLNGYNIPKVNFNNNNFCTNTQNRKIFFFSFQNTTLLLNLHAAHHDATLFPEPYIFKPERFISSEGKLINQESVLAFGLGKTNMFCVCVSRN